MAPGNNPYENSRIDFAGETQEEVEEAAGGSTSWLEMSSISRGLPGCFVRGTTDACEEGTVDAAERWRFSALLTFSAAVNRSHGNMLGGSAYQANEW